MCVNRLIFQSAPKITLNYSSQAGAGIAGFGWSIGGLSAITRGPQTKLIDGQNRAMDFTSEDRFYLDGKRLVVIDNATYGADGAEYRTEIESFTRVVSYDSTSGSPGWFRAWTKSGLIIEFGHTADSRFRPQNQTAPLSWAVSKISDISGNYMTYHYTVDATSGEQVLDSIKYTGHDGAPSLPTYASLEFEYEPRCDYSFGYIHGAKLSSLQRLKKIRSLHGVSEVRAYTLNYTSRDNPDYRETDRSMLTSITESGTGGVTCLPLTFTYSNPPAGWQDVDATFSPPTSLAGMSGLTSGTCLADQGVFFIDMTGDGRPDCLQKLGVSGSTVVNMAWLNTPDGWVEAIGANGQHDYRLPDPLTLSNNDPKEIKPDTGVRFADINGDGLVDVMDKEGSVYLNTGTGWVYNARFSLPDPPRVWDIQGDLTYKRGHLDLLDLTGDGRVDYSTKSTVMIGAWTFYGVYDTCINHGGGTEGELGSAWTAISDPSKHTVPYDSSQHGVVFLDLNGDGKTDIIVATGSETHAFIRTSTGWYDDPAYHLPVPLYLSGSISLGGQLADFNSDGLPDFVSYNSGTGANNHKVACINTGTGWLIPQQGDPMHTFNAWTDMGHNGESLGIAIVDINNDGIPDFSAAYHVTRASYHGSGTGWILPPADVAYHLPFPLATVQNNYPYYPVYLGNPGSGFLDINADGAVDFFWSWKRDGIILKGNEGARLNKRANPDRLTSVDNGLGVTVSVTYAPLTEIVPAGDDPIYEKGSGAVTPVQDVIGPMYVVKTVTNDDGAGGTYDINYRYGGLRSHLDHGDLGFEWMQAIDSRTHIRTKTLFKQDYPFIGLPDGSFTDYCEPGQAEKSLSVVANTYNYLSLNNDKTVFPYVAELIEKSWELNGAPTSDIVTTYTYDSYGNATVIEVDTSGGAGEYTRTVINTYDDQSWVSAPSQTSLNCWLPGRPMSTTVETRAPNPSGGSPLVQTRVSDFEYDSNNGLLLMEIIEPGNISDPGDPTLELTNAYTYNAFGCRTTTTTTGDGLDPAGRTTTTTYDPIGRFPWKTTNALGHTETYTHCPDLGVLLETIGPNGLATSWEYDSFARVVKETRADGTQTITNRHWTGAGFGAPSGALYYVETKSFKQISGSVVYCSPPSAVFYDKMGRPVSSWSVHPGGPDGAASIVIADTYYDPKGRANITSLPYFKGATPPGFTEVLFYDALNRPLTISTPDDEVGDDEVFSTIEYSGLVTRTTNPLNQVEEVTRNMQGQVIKRINNAGATDPSERGEIHYAYDAGNNLVKTTVYHENGTPVTTNFAYDNRGRKTSMTSPDVGTWTYEYNALGELTKQTDAKGQTTSMTYDNLGRPLTRTDYNSSSALACTTTWTYDDTTTSGAKSIGKPSTILVQIPGKHTQDYKETYLYDSLGRLKTLTRRIDTNDYPVTQEYDPDTGHPTVTVYPGNFRVRNVYNALGFLKEVRAANDPLAPTITGDVSHNHLFWQADSYSVHGAIESSTLGNGLTTDRYISPKTGRLRTITSGIGLGRHAQDIAYSHNPLGHVVQRQDCILGRDETFAYDGLNRLTVWNLGVMQAMTGWGTVVPPVTPGTVTILYNALGNITAKSDHGTYTYSGVNAGPHAVTSVLDTATTRTYTYDANGNMTARTDINRTQDWNTFNQVEKITHGLTWASFRFGANRERIVQERNDNTKTIYIGSLLEIVTNTASGFSEKKYHIHTPEGKVATRTLRGDSQGETAETRYYHSDGLGSITAVSDEYGRIEKRLAYDPWGKRTLLIDYHAGPGGSLTRGFTGHEHLDDFGLIHMNARIFDPALGRFMSADSIVQGAGNSQFYNRYSYCTNNPLNYTDPTGALSWGLGRNGGTFGWDFYGFVGVGFNVGWRKGGSIGVYGQLGPTWKGFTIGARINFDYGFRSMQWHTSTSFFASYQGFGINATYSKRNGWDVGITWGVNLMGDNKSGVSLSIEIGKDDFSIGLNGYWNPRAGNEPNTRGQRESVKPAEAVAADYLAQGSGQDVSDASTESGEDKYPHYQLPKQATCVLETGRNMAELLTGKYISRDEALAIASRITGLTPEELMRIGTPQYAAVIQAIIDSAGGASQIQYATTYKSFVSLLQTGLPLAVSVGYNYGHNERTDTLLIVTHAVMVQASISDNVIVNVTVIDPTMKLSATGARTATVEVMKANEIFNKLTTSLAGSTKMPIVSGIPIKKQ